MADNLVKMPRLGESVTEGTVSAWFKQVGDTVEFDEPLFEVSTDKVDSEIPSPFAGQILEILVPAGATVPVDTPLVRIGDPEATVSSATPAIAVPVSPPPATVPVSGALANTGAHSNGGRLLLSPIVRRLATEHSVDLGSLLGSGAGGRIMREDVEKAIAARAGAQTGVAAPPIPAPAVVPPSSLPASAPPPSPPGTAPALTGAEAGRSETVVLPRLRQVIGENMLRSLATSAHVWTSIEVDLENIEQLRRAHKERFRHEEGVSLTYLAFIARAVCDALRRFPAVNASIDPEAKTMTFHHYVNLGIAVDLDEQGLVVPVVKGADALNLRGLAHSIAAVAAAARSRSLSADDMRRSTFTITNPGPMGDYASAPIINQPNVAILSTNQVARRPTVVGDFVGIHHMTILGLSYDHRAFDGVTASKFLAYVRDALQGRDWAAELQ